MQTREPTSAGTGAQPDLRLGSAGLRSLAHAEAARTARAVRRALAWLWLKASWRMLASGALLLVAVLVIHGIPLRERVRMEAKLLSNFTRAPVLMVGDSITYEAAPAHLCGARVFNAAVPGDRIADLLSDAPDYSARLPAARVVVVAVGVNDAWPNHKDLPTWISEYRALLALYAGRELLLVEINPADPARLARKLDADFIAAANAAIRQIAAETGARVVPAPEAALTRDGLHPSPAGTALWRDRLSAAACAGPAGLPL